MGIWTAGGFFVPAAARADAVAAVGSLAEDNPGRTVWAFDAWLHKALSDDPPDAVIMWINEPDSAGHRHGVGAPETLRAAANVDKQIGRIVAAHAENGLSDRVNVFVTSDHGFSTNAGRFSVARTLRENDVAADELTIVGNMIFLARDDPALLVRVVEALQRDPEAGNVYTRPARPGSSEGIVPGTLSTAVIQWDHARAADVVVSPGWTDEVNEFGFAGASTRGGRSAASHGSDSPYDMQIRLVAAGPDIKRGVRSRVPTGNVDLAPTVLHLLGIEPPPDMSGRVLHELLRDGHSPDEIALHKQTHRAAVTLPEGLRYEAELDTLQVGSTVYIRGARTIRSK
jgi:arylsulfatase A-like enzyme